MILSGLRARVLVRSVHERGPRGALTALTMGPPGRSPVGSSAPAC